MRIDMRQLKAAIKQATSDGDATRLTKLLIFKSGARISRAKEKLSNAEELFREVLVEARLDATKALIHKERVTVLKKLGDAVSKARRNSHARVVKAETVFRLGALSGQELNFVQSLQNVDLHNGRFVLSAEDVKIVTKELQDEFRLVVAQV